MKMIFPAIMLFAVSGCSSGQEETLRAENHALEQKVEKLERQIANARMATDDLQSEVSGLEDESCREVGEDVQSSVENVWDALNL